MTASTTIRRPIEDVFAYVADSRNDVHWAPLVASVEQVRGDGPGLGAVYRVGQRTGPTTVNLDWEIVAYAPPRHLAWSMQTRLFRYQGHMDFTEINSGDATLVTHTTTMTYRIPGAAAVWRIGATKVLRTQLTNLNRILDSE